MARLALFRDSPDSPQRHLGDTLQRLAAASPPRLRAIEVIADAMLRRVESSGAGAADSCHGDHAVRAMMTRTPLYRFRADGWRVEVFDTRVSIVERRIGASLPDDLAHLAQLRERGVLSEDEFVAAKRRVIGE